MKNEERDFNQLKRIINEKNVQLYQEIEQEKRVTKWNIIFLVLAFVVCSLSLLNTFKIPYIGDDEINSLTKGAMEYYGKSLWTHTWQIAKIWISNGRFLPLSFYSYSIFLLFPDLLSYRIFFFVLNHLTIAAFAGFIYQMTKKWEVMCISVIMTAVFFQYRDYHDAILAYHGMMQFVAVLFFVSLIFQLRAMEKEQIKYSVASGICFFLNLLLYEISYTFVIVYLLFALFYRKGKNRFRFFAPHFCALLCSGITTLVVRILAKDVAYGGISFSFQPAMIVCTFVKQFISTFPLSYLLIIKDQIYDPIWQYLTPYQFILLGVFFILILFCGFRFIRIGSNSYRTSMTLYRIPKFEENPTEKTKKENVQKTRSEHVCHWERNLFLIGLTLCIVPAGIISLSARYQQDLRFGEGYLPVYLQYFGAVCCTTSIFFFLLRMIKKTSLKSIICMVLAVCSTCILFFVLAINQVVVDIIVKNSVQPVSNHAASAGLFDLISERDRVFVIQGGMAPEYEAESFVCLYADGLKIGPVKINHLLDEFGKNTEPVGDYMKLYPKNIYGFYASGTLEDGFAAIFLIDEIDYSPSANYVTQVYTKEMRVFYIGHDEGKEIYLPRIDQNGEVTGVFAEVFESKENEVFAPLRQNSGEQFNLDNDAGNKMIVSQAEIIDKAPEGMKKWFLLDQGDTYSFFVRSENFPILVRGISFTDK